MDLLHLVDRLEELVGSAQKMPIGSRAIVDRRRILDIVDQMRVAVPQEVRDAQAMVNQRDELYREAEEEARLIIARAEERASRMVEQHALTIAARARAEEVAKQAEGRIEERLAEANAEIEQRIQDSQRIADQQMEAADDYARQLLSRLETQLQAFIRSVQSGIQQLETPERASDANTASEIGYSAVDPGQQWRDGSVGAGTEDGLENLLPAQKEAEETPADPGVIDDFAMPQFDDERTVAPVRAGDEEQEASPAEDASDPRP